MTSVFVINTFSGVWIDLSHLPVNKLLLLRSQLFPSSFKFSHWNRRHHRRWHSTECYITTGIGNSNFLTLCCHVSTYSLTFCSLLLLSYSCCSFTGCVVKVGHVTKLRKRCSHLIRGIFKQCCIKRGLSLWTCCQLCFNLVSSNTTTSSKLLNNTTLSHAFCKLIGQRSILHFQCWR